MTATYATPGTSMPHTPVADVAAGDVVVVGDTVAVAPRPISAGTPGTLATEGGFRMPKAAGSGTAIAAGKKVWWNAGGTTITETASTHKVAGYTLEASTDDDTEQLVRLARA